MSANGTTACESPAHTSELVLRFRTYQHMAECELAGMPSGHHSQPRGLVGCNESLRGTTGATLAAAVAVTLFVASTVPKWARSHVGVSGVSGRTKI